MKKILLTNIQRFSLYDGPGIRTTIFLKGCSLRCPWCSNPENLISVPQNYIKDGISGIYGKYYSQDELVSEVLKDKPYYTGEFTEPSMWNITNYNDIEKLPGGVTFSGGEALLQMLALIPVCKEFRKNDVHITIETCLFVPENYIILALKYIDFFYIDMKILDKSRAKDVVKGNLDLYLHNLDLIMKSDKPVVIRIPVIGGYTDDVKNRKMIFNLLDKYKNRILKTELIKEHNLGEYKYKTLGMKSTYYGVDDSVMIAYKKLLEPLNMPIEICKI